MRLSFRSVALFSVPVLILALALACGGSAKTSLVGSEPPTGTAAIILTDAPSDLWSSVEVVVTQVTLRSKADHTKEVVAFSGTSAKVNLVDLDSVGELLATATIPVGTYDGLRVTIDPASLTLVKADGTTVPASQVHVQGSSIMVELSADLVVAAGSNNAVQLDFDLGHPLFIVQLPNGDWAVNLQIKHRPNAASLAGMVLRHRRGTVASVGTASFVLHTAAGNDLTIHTDTGTWYWNADIKAAGTFAGLAAGKNVLASLRMQADGSLWAVRVWYGAAALPEFTPEGHVLGVDLRTGTISITTTAGMPRPVVIDADTTFTYGGQTLGTGTAFLPNVWAGFKVQLEVKDPLAAPMHARSLDIQRAVDGGIIKAATATGFTYQHPRAGDRTHAFASPFTWWYLGFPGITSTNSNAFVAAVTNNGDVLSAGASDLQWNPGTRAWDAATAIFLPVDLPTGTISTSYNAGQLAYTFTGASGRPQTITVTLNTTVGMQPTVLELNRQTGMMSAVPLALSAWPTKLVANAKAKVAVVPKPNGDFAAYAVVLFTGF